MNTTQTIQKLIETNNPKDYYYFAEFRFVSASFLLDIQKALRQGKEKYIQATKGVLEMQAVQGILRKTSRLEDGLSLVREAREKGKPNISVALLEPEKKFEIEIPMPYEEVEGLAEEFINYLSCPSFVFGRCINTFPHDILWTEKVNCYDVHRTALILLRKYSGGDHRIALHSMIKIRGEK